MWTNEQILALRKHAWEVFKIEIPLSIEIQKIQLFLEQTETYSVVRPRILKLFKREIQLPTFRKNGLYNFNFRWNSNLFEFPTEIELPKELFEEFRQAAQKTLDLRCNQLEKMCNFNKIPHYE